MKRGFLSEHWQFARVVLYEILINLGFPGTQSAYRKALNCTLYRFSNRNASGVHNQIKSSDFRALGNNGKGYIGKGNTLSPSTSFQFGTSLNGLHFTSSDVHTIGNDSDVIQLAWVYSAVDRLGNGRTINHCDQSKSKLLFINSIQAMCKFIHAVIEQFLNFIVLGMIINSLFIPIFHSFSNYKYNLD